MRYLFLLAVATTLAAQPRPLTHRDYDSWRTISATQISRDGKWVAYGFMPQDGDGDLLVREIATGKEYKHPAGALPPPPVIPAAEMNPEAEPPRTTLTVRFTSDSQYAISTYFPTKAETAKNREAKPGVMIVKLSDGSVTRIADVKAFSVPAKGGAWLAAHRSTAAAEAPAATTANDADQRRGGGRSGGGRAPAVGSELVVRNLATGEDKSLPDVTEYLFARDGKALVYAVGAKNEESNGIFLWTPEKTSPVLTGKGRFTKLAWDREQRQLAFVSSFVSSKDTPGKFALYLWNRATAEARQVVGPDQKIVDRGTLGFSRDGKKLYAATGAPTVDPPKAPVADQVQMDLWHFRDDLIQPMQKVRANQERARTYRAVYDLATNRFTPIADETLAEVTFSDDGTAAIGSDTRPYRRMVDYDGTYSDYYWVNTATGERKLVAKQLRGGGFGGSPMQWSPDGRRVLYFSQGHWHIAGPADSRNATATLGVQFDDEQDDTPDPAQPYGSAGWSKDSTSVIVYDRYDVWQLFADPAQAPRKWTNGRRDKLQFRVQRLDPVDEEDEERGLDLAKPLTLRAVSEETRQSGFYRAGATGAPQQLIWGAKNYAVAARAQDADVVLITASRFDEFPDLHATNTNFAAPKRISAGGDQLKPFAWGTAETVRFRNTDGVSLKATLIKPANFDPQKKYPMLVYIYERLSQNVHNFVNPTPGTSINTSYYASNGYLILMPDIVYTKGYPGQSALKCVLPAIDAVVEKGFVRESSIGIQGHSWGGYQIAYMVTQTNRFKAAEAGAPVGNMTSAYSGIRWGSGLPRQFQYEQTQSRIGETLYQNPQKFLENSPVFHIQRVKTPLLILHNDNDDAVPWYQGIELYLALRRNEKEAYLLNYNGEYHGLRRRHNQKDWTVRMQEFFDHHLKDQAKPAWMEKGVPYLERDQPRP